VTDIQASAALTRLGKKEAREKAAWKKSHADEKLQADS
jgi:hypothetical protein